MVLQNQKEPKKGLGLAPTHGEGGGELGSNSIMSSSSSSANEQPVIKRQRIENDDESIDVVDRANTSINSSTASSSGNSSNGSSLVASTCSSSTSLSSSPPTSSSSMSRFSATKLLDGGGGGGGTAVEGGTDEDLLSKQVQDYQALFQEAIVKQCLCGVETNVLLMSFQSYYVNGGGGGGGGIGSEKGKGAVRQFLPLIEWPFEYLLKYLSNVQLLFDTYLKQNIKGTICSGVMDLCNYLIRSESQHPEMDFISMNIDEIIGLCNYNNKFINYLSGRILSSFLIIIKDDLDDRWLEKIVVNLFDFNQLDVLAVKKINFSLDIIKRIVEWKDETEHPLEEEAHGQGPSTSSGEASTSSAFHPPPLENNYFAAHYGSQQYDSESTAGNIFTPPSSSSPNSGGSTPLESSIHHSLQHPGPTAGPGQQLCHIITLTDSESFDTTRIKCETISILGNKWPALVKNISHMIRAPAASQPQNAQSQTAIATETCILTFLRLWESIISVKANLSVVDTQPFHSQLDHFQLLLLSTKNSVIYKQMLTLFNEALCYGSTLALQDFIPEEVGSLAHNVVRSVKDHRILDKMPKSTYTSVLGFIGFKGEAIRYHNSRLSPEQKNGRGGTNDGSLAGNNGSGNASSGSSSSSNSASGNPIGTSCYDRTLMQKMALLVLKAVAVIVKEIRCDSSDSSVDSSDFDMQEIQMIERSIRDVVKKLETFLKAQLEFHPDSHFSKVLIHLFDDQDDYLVEAMVCTLDVTSGISFRNNAFPELIAILNPVYTFIEFSNLGPNITHLFLDLLISTETCFLLFLLRFLKYVRQNWSMFTQSCLSYYQHNSYSNASTLLQSIRSCNIVINNNSNNVILDCVMTVLISLRLQISRLVADTLFPYNIGPILRLIENCESLYEGNELS
ncbi:protein lines [Toxorhynchites rutilus septentrionalis]|uniref:protein lines n=1 Tax=Toxorhynchites rutilus septentrionalis TaxID=329112 RepID=UPI00247A9469|nr:protein lines [Toxorhynchites rutilus septentrionalis]